MIKGQRRNIFLNYAEKITPKAERDGDRKSGRIKYIPYS